MRRTPHPPAGGSPPGLVDHYFRHEYGRLVAVLVRRTGLHQLAAVEDAVQSALETALTAWLTRGIPDNPSGWLYHVAENQLFGERRKAQRQRRVLDGNPELGVPEQGQEPGSLAYTGELGDELLRMLFVCCDEEIPQESRLVLALKTLCGFSVGEIAFRLFTTEANIYKRLGRARERLRKSGVDLETPPLAALRSRLPSVHSVLYLLFNEGYLSSNAEQAIRAELCDEAIRLGTLLAAHPVGAEPVTFALLALMHLHAARLASRQDASGGLLLLEEQDRSRWDVTHLQLGATWLERAGHGVVFSRFHAEAGIAAEHCFAASFEDTQWRAIAALYQRLERIDPSPLHTLNRAIAVAQADGPQVGLAVLEQLTPPSWFEGHYLLAAVLADLHHRAGNPELARRHREQALGAAPSLAIRQVLSRRLNPS